MRDVKLVYCRHCGQMVEEKEKRCPFCNKTQPGNQSPAIAVLTFLTVVFAIAAAVMCMLYLRQNRRIEYYKRLQNDEGQETAAGIGGGDTFAGTTGETTGEETEGSSDLKPSYYYMVTPELRDALDSFVDYTDSISEFMKQYDRTDPDQVAEYEMYKTQFSQLYHEILNLDQSAMTSYDKLYYGSVISRTQSTMIGLLGGRRYLDFVSGR